eukprot:NP_001296817.1 uncharacterized protein LOC100193746 [Zea mays]
MDTAVFSPADLFHGVDDSDDDRDEMQICSDGEKPVALEYQERVHDFPDMVEPLRSESC